MRSTLPKAMHPLGGQPMILHLLATAQQVFERIVVVIGPGMEHLAALCEPHRVVVQEERLGTGHAARTAEAYFGEGDVAVLYADNPLITATTMENLLTARADRDAALALVAMQPADPGRYGRVVLRDGNVDAIVEWKDASRAQRAIGLCNAGVICAPAADLRRWLNDLTPDNAQSEYYLTDCVAAAAREGSVTYIEAPEAELAGVNSRSELARAEAALQKRLRDQLFDAGVTLVAPETVFLSIDTLIEPDVIIEPNVVIGAGVTIRSGATIRAFSHLEGCDVGKDAVIGPYARLRPGTHCGAQSHVGNFVELKNVTLGIGAKANHLTYLGDATIGARTNIGAGTITCNYDGVFKHRTAIGENAFIGSDSILVAPVQVGDGALVAAGSVITENVPEGAAAFGRARQTNKDDRGREIRAALLARKESL